MLAICKCENSCYVTTFQIFVIKSDFFSKKALSLIDYS